MRTYIYIDGFNFYYGAVKNTPYKWLDFKSFFQKLLDPRHDIISIKYFTAQVSGKIDPRQPVRQKTYLRALQKHIPELSVHLGHFSTQDVVSPLSWNHKNLKIGTIASPELDVLMSRSFCPRNTILTKLKPWPRCPAIIRNMTTKFFLFQSLKPRKKAPT